MRFVETNFIPKFVLLGNTTATVLTTETGAGVTVNIPTDNTGLLKSSTVFFFKVTRKDLLRGFEESISIAHSATTAATGDTESLDFVAPSTAGYVYNVYFDTVAAGGTGTDATMKLIKENLAASATYKVTAVPTSGATAPASLRSTGDGADPAAIHPVFIVAEAALSWAGFYKSKVLMSPTGPTNTDPLAQRRTVGYKFFGKSVIKDQTRLLRLEVASNY